jgi:hypothetical protein
LSGKQAPAACAAREGRHALEPAGIPLVPVEQVEGFVPSSELDQGLDLVDDETSGASLGKALGTDVVPLRS